MRDLRRRANRGGEHGGARVGHALIQAQADLCEPRLGQQPRELRDAGVVNLVATNVERLDGRDVAGDRLRDGTERDRLDAIVVEPQPLQDGMARQPARDVIRAGGAETVATQKELWL